MAAKAVMSSAAPSIMVSTLGNWLGIRLPDQVRLRARFVTPGAGEM
jgi:hypothetical protein